MAKGRYSHVHLGFRRNVGLMPSWAINTNVCANWILMYLSQTLARMAQDFSGNNPDGRQAETKYQMPVNG